MAAFGRMQIEAGRSVVDTWWHTWKSGITWGVGVLLSVRNPDPLFAAQCHLFPPSPLRWDNVDISSRLQVAPHCRLLSCGLDFFFPRSSAGCTVSNPAMGPVMGGSFSLLHHQALVIYLTSKSGFYQLK